MDGGCSPWQIKMAPKRNWKRGTGNEAGGIAKTLDAVLAEQPELRREPGRTDNPWPYEPQVKW